MAQNTSTAVMQRRVEPHDSLDFFPTPPWAGRALIEHVLIGGGWRRDSLARMTCWEPACGEGDLANGLEGFYAVWMSDVHDYGCEGAFVHDFLFPTLPRFFTRDKPDWIITNPPFRLAEQFAHRALGLAREGVALFVRSAFLEGCGRHERLFRDHPPSIVAQFCERVPLVKGRYDPRASSATAYSWLVWLKGEEGTRFVWIPPCRKALERPGDYPASEAAL